MLPRLLAKGDNEIVVAKWTELTARFIDELQQWRGELEQDARRAQQRGYRDLAVVFLRHRDRVALAISDGTVLLEAIKLRVPGIKAGEQANIKTRGRLR